MAAFLQVLAMTIASLSSTTQISLEPVSCSLINELPAGFYALPRHTQLDSQAVHTLQVFGPYMTSNRVSLTSCSAICKVAVSASGNATLTCSDPLAAPKTPASQTPFARRTCNSNKLRSHHDAPRF